MQEQFAENVSVSHSASVGLRQFAFKIENAVADRIVPPGGHVVCVPYRAARPRGPRYGDVLLVHKTNASGRDEWIVARATYCSDRWELHFESNDPRWEHETILPSSDWIRDLNDDCVIDVVGFVQGVMTDLRPAQVSLDRPTRLRSLRDRTCAVCQEVAILGVATAAMIWLMSSVGGKQALVLYASFSGGIAWLAGTVRSSIVNAGSALGTAFLYEPAYSFEIASAEEATNLAWACAFAVLASGAAITLRHILHRRLLWAAWPIISRVSRAGQS